MDRETFRSRLLEATEKVLAFTPKFVTNALPRQCLYLVYPNCSNDAARGPIGKDEERFPEDSQLGVLGPLDVKAVVDFLWRNGRIPQWININARSVDENYTYMRLICCGRFVGESRKLMHERYGVPPFNWLGPHMPPWIEHSNDGVSEKFDLNSFCPD